jgi:DNA-binding transcriptional MerR regulator
MNDGLTIQQVAQRTGLSIHMLRYYEHLGLLISVHRLLNGQKSWI